MEDKNSLASFWSGQVPFVASVTLTQLRLWALSSPWFTHSDTSKWFDIDNSELNRLQTEYQTEWTQLCIRLMTQKPFTFTDKRFASKDWEDPMFGSLAAFYLLNAKFLKAVADLLQIDDTKARMRMDYLVDQTVAANAPSNFLMTNPDVLRKMFETRGGSLFTGMLQLAEDIKEGKMRQCDKSDFQVGVTLACTPGKVVFQNELIQLIQYAPQSKNQYKVPIFIVPPCINKYYILDLRPENSFIRYALEQGHQVFLISWKNADLSLADKTWDNYLQEGIITGMGVARAISGCNQMNTLGFCIGGTLLTCALAVLAARGDVPPASLTLFTSFLDYRDTGTIDIYVDEEMIDYRERTIGGKHGAYGIFRGEDMGNTFSLLRPDELWWNYTIDKYLKGEKPRTLDLLFWNNDSTNLPGAFYSYYLRHAYLQNDLKSGKLYNCSVRMDFRNINCPVFIYGSQRDHIVPWKSAYASVELLPGPKRFVLGASGHVAGVINPPSANKRSYWTNDKITPDPDLWFKGAKENPGSWWTDWEKWVTQYSGAKIPAVTQLGTPEFSPMEDAPGSYIFEQP